MTDSDLDLTSTGNQTRRILTPLIISLTVIIRISWQYRLNTKISSLFGACFGPIRLSAISQTPGLLHFNNSAQDKRVHGQTQKRDVEPQSVEDHLSVRDDRSLSRVLRGYPCWRPGGNMQATRVLFRPADHWGGIIRTPAAEQQTQLDRRVASPLPDQ